MKLSTIEQACQVVELLNRRNQLVIEYTPEGVFDNKNDFFIIEEGNKVVACGETKKVQWYQWEIRHVSVLEDHEGKGYGSRVVKNLENIIREGGGRIAQCTIRHGNMASEVLFISKGFQLTIRFYYSRTGNEVGVYQKNLTD
jgi:ribosomal protein S18 acetylase RimI-like enzyme